MIISLWLLFYVMALHWLADFVLQSDKMARGKSKSNYWLSIHVLVYTSVMFLGMFLLSLNLVHLALWTLFNGSAHWVTDYFTSRGSSYFFQKEDYHNGFVVVGADQYAHLVCLTVSTCAMTIGV